jgi:hypothetical protein
LGWEVVSSPSRNPRKVKPDENVLFQVVIIDVDFSAIMILMGYYVRGWGQWMVSFIPNIYIIRAQKAAIN